MVSGATGVHWGFFPFRETIAFFWGDELICLKRTALLVPRAMARFAQFAEQCPFPVSRFAVGKKQAQDRLLNRAVMSNPELPFHKNDEL